jgi:tRNA A-37 threonylcarbamoyl transferase component Bud32/uncharacterized protein Yka (UPF0111/DUF47 family)
MAGEKVIILTCPKCGSRHKVTDLKVAEKFICPDCRTPVATSGKFVSDEMTVEGQAVPAAATRKTSKEEILREKTIAGCRLMAKLGQGGMGVVYKAHHPRLDKIVAVKVLSLNIASPEHRKRFLDEARAAAQLEHPNIVQVFDVGEEQGTYYIIMQFVEGESLEKLIAREGALEPKRAAKMLRDVARALKVAHDRNLIHRDIKPDNVFISKGDEVKLGDFGLVRDLTKDQHLTAAGVVLGTPYYMAPEQFKTDRVDGRADIYALGITFYHMLAGFRPFEGNTPLAVMKLHLTEPMPEIPDARYKIPEQLSRLVKKMTAKEPEERCQSVDEVLKGLDDYIGPDRVVWKISPALIAAVIALVAGLAIAGYYLFQSMGETSRLEEEKKALELKQKALEEKLQALSRGGIAEVKEAVKQISKVESEGGRVNEQVKSEVNAAGLKKVDAMLTSASSAANSAEVEAAKDIIKMLGATAQSPAVASKKSQLVKKGFEQTERIDKTKHRIATAEEEAGGKALLDAYRNIDGALDEEVKRVYSEVDGVAQANSAETDLPMDEEERKDIGEILATAREMIEKKESYRDARLMINPYLKSPSREIRDKTRQLLEAIATLEKSSEK